jgi:S-adenosylmethionine decarboxylase
VLGARSHAFDPYGATAFVLLAESHIALHSWPELEYVSFDVLLCGGSAHRAAEVIVGELLPEQHRLHIVERGSPPLPVPAERPPR